MLLMPVTRFVLLALIILFVGISANAADRAASEWVHRGDDGKLQYKTTPAGDRIMDFSYAGYRGGGVALPEAPVKRTVQPASGEADATKAIQVAIDEVSKLPPDKDGFRGAVLLAPGEFVCGSTININASGVVLRGSGSAGKGGSTIKMTGTPHVAIAAPARNRYGAASAPAEDSDLNPRGGDGGGGRGGREIETKIADDYVPCGATSFTVADARKFSVGDAIIIRRPVTRSWVEFMHMDDMTRNDKPQTWIKVGSTTNTERTIAAIDGKKITLDVPLSDSFDAKYLNPPGTIVAKAPLTPRLSEVGIENLHIECPPQAISHTQPNFSAIRLNGENCWICDVNIDETMNSVAVGGRRITLRDVHIVRKAKHQGSSRPAEFAPNGSQVLLDRCSVTGDNIWYVGTGAGVAGPVVILNCTFRGDGRAESHQRWSTGLLYDNCHAPGGGIEMRNRGSMGSGHGWTMGWGVIWNCAADGFLAQNPPGAHNWVIGSIGKEETAPRPFGEGPPLPQATIDSPGKPVTPASLYLAQLEARLGKQALKNIGYGDANEIGK